MTPLPTVTLAKLFEQQEQYVEALALYQLLFIKFQDNNFLSKISELKENIFANNNEEYHQMIISLFTDDERKQLQILPHSQYSDYKEAYEQFQDSKKTATPKQPKEAKTQRQPEFSDILQKLEKIDPQELEILAYETFNKKVNELTISELKELVEEYNNR